jgi:O-succinylbenzoate synthase
VRIRKVTLTRVRIPLREPFRISNGSVSDKESILVRIETDGAEGFGEASPMSGSFYSAETPESTWDALAGTLAPRLLERGVIDLDELPALFADVEGEPFAKAGIDGACWEAAARSKGVPLLELLGGRRRRLASGVAIGIYPTVGELLARVERYVGEGYQRVKIKIEPGWDLEPVEKVRRRFPATPLQVDANGAYTLGEAAVLERLDRFGLVMIEQPLAPEALEEHAELQRRLRTPICLDESADTLEALETILRLGSGRIVNIKVQRVGGLGTARALYDRCAAAGVPCWLGTMPELGVASAQGLHLGTLPNFIYPTDVEASERWFVGDIVEPPITIDRQGWIDLPDGVGCGYRLDRRAIEHYTLQEKILAP